MSENTFTTRVKFFVFLIPFVFLLFAFATSRLNPPLYRGLFGTLEGGLFEWVQFGCFALASFFGFRTFLLLKRSSLKIQSFVMIIFSLGCAFIALEEISYGQHIFKWGTPEQIASVNLQGETNLHNLAAIHGKNIQVKAFIFVGWCGSIAWMLRRNPKKLSVRDIVLPEWYISSFFLPLAVFYTQLLYFFGYGNYHQETFETVLSFGFLGVAYVNHFKAGHNPTKQTLPQS